MTSTTTIPSATSVQKIPSLNRVQQIRDNLVNLRLGFFGWPWELYWQLSTFQNKGESVQQETNENHANHCSDCNKSFATNTEFILHFNDCQFKNLLVPMEQDGITSLFLLLICHIFIQYLFVLESSDDEFQDTAIDDNSSILPDKSNARYVSQIVRIFVREIYPT